jgi:S1-C subfamily serine protease
VNVLDVIILVAAIAYGFTGFRNGAVIGAMSLLGFFIGAVLGAQLASPLGSWLADGHAQVPIAIVCVLMLAMLGQLAGIWIGGHIKTHVVRERGRPVDSGAGLVFGVVSVLLVAWMVAVPLASSPYPALASAASHSTIVRGVDDVMPDDVRSLYSSLRDYLDRSGFPPVFGDLPDAPIIGVPAPDALTPATKQRMVAIEPSVVKIYGSADSCDRRTEGSGFVYAPDRIMTNAHVVAGASEVAVQVGRGDLRPASVVVYDPETDVAVLRVKDLGRRALSFAGAPASTGDPSVVLGYPEDGPYTAGAARVRSRTTVSGADIYGSGSVRREVYAVRATVRSGNSGGPLVTNTGEVLGVVFATALDSSDTGYALTAAEVAHDASAGRTADAPVETGRCTAG